MRRLALIAILGLTHVAFAQDASDSAPVRYQANILPILKRHCLGCHNPREADGGLDMTTVASFRKGGKSGPAFVAGKPDESLFVQMLLGQKTPVMPYKQPPLSPAKIQLLKNWVLAGAKEEAPPVSAKSGPPDVYHAPPEITSLAFSPDGETLAVGCRSEVVLLAPTGGTPRQRLVPDGDLVTFVGFQADGETLAVAGGTPGVFGEVRFYDFRDGKASLRHQVKLGTDTFFRGAFAPNKRVLALGAADGSAYLFPTDREAKPRKLDLHSDWVTEVAFSGDGKLLLSGSRDKSVKAVQVESGQVLRVIATLGEAVTGVAMTPGFALSVCREKSLNSFDLKQALGDIVLLGTGNNVVPTGKPAEYTRKLETFPGEVSSLTLDAARQRIAVVGRFPEVRIHEVPSGQRLGTIVGLQSPVNVAAWSADGKWLAVGSQSGQVTLVDGTTYKIHKQYVPVPVK